VDCWDIKWSLRCAIHFGVCVFCFEWYHTLPTYYLNDKIFFLIKGNYKSALLIFFNPAKKIWDIDSEYVNVSQKPITFKGTIKHNKG
jgi:hypothetical protein